ncbi:Phage_integrase domain-containing protein [Rubrivivax sp. A210]|uniref:tyrosine-type recombinase/integrase n=1 Tax=Rubrivivax sp. A210 TaxID=2772301 RepID=UPI00191A9E53|nr:tyrosine-type recombinase/integrase [Rubrivivax sp. A210]CAD5374837.1 Phage_integrase domain-containing protein [Rubrivivax sp. A210]
MADRIDTVDARNKLKLRRSPYWHRLSTGVHLGFRKMTADSPGTWLVRTYDPATRDQPQHKLGAFDHLTPSQRFDAAKIAAEKYAEHLAQGGRTGVCTVRDACDDYVKHLRTKGRAEAAALTESRFVRLVHGSRIANIDLTKLTQRHMRAWHSELAATPVCINGRAQAGAQRTRARSTATLNRDVARVRAALNFARRGGAVTTDAAWRDELRAEPGAARQRDLYLDKGQREALMTAARPELFPLLRAIHLLPLRPGAAAVLTAADYDKRIGVLTVRKDKAGAGRKLKLTGAVEEFFTSQSNSKLPAAVLLARADGSMWTRRTWSRPIKLAAEAAGLPPQTVAYSFRHSVITDLLTSGLDVMTVARMAGTSVQQINAHYGHLVPDRTAAALAALAG